MKFFSNMGYSEEIVHEVIRKYGPCTQPLLRSEEIEEENQRLQGHRNCVPCSVCPDATQSRSVGVGGSTSDLTGNSTPKNTQSHTEESVEENISLLPLIDSKPYTSNGRVNCFRRGPAGQKHVMCGRNEKDNGNVNLKSNGLSQSLSSSSHEEVSIILRGATGHQRDPAFPKNDFLHQADPLFPNNVKAAYKKPSGFYSSLQPKPRYSQNSLLLPLPQLLPSDTKTVLAGASDHTDSVVTGVQRFRDMLKTPYKLELKKCTQQKNITVFVPQWRTRRHPNVKEQHFLTQLKEVGILSLTSSRMVLGERIAASHVDSFLLHLAHKTAGVIVSNNNFRKFVTESVSWREIVAKRLLQYMFVGNIFLVPNNPLGRNGPRVEEFLRKEGSGDLEPLLSALQNVDMFAQSHNTQLPHFTSLASTSDIEQNHLMPAQSSSAETSELREALLNIFPDSEQKQKIEEILAAQPFLKDLNVLSGLILDLSLD
ncbi:hypothetical protein U0070_001609 [Myodes glareolus]|uniref:NEDD4-binding protein 1 n=1 Tax=Myodes glareolus TaxID=447135 RepID=A0AAW0J7F1_MYOGA